MSVVDYIEKYYGPYMCRTDRHKWETVIPPNYEEGTDGLASCKWCKCEKKLHSLTLLNLARRNSNNEKYMPIIEAMVQKNAKFLEDIPYKRA